MKMPATPMQPNWMSTSLRRTMSSSNYAGKTSSVAHVGTKLKVNSDDELVEDDATCDHDPQLPGSPSRTEAISARLMQEARGGSANAHNEAEQSEAKRMKVARNLRIQSILLGFKLYM